MCRRDPDNVSVYRVGIRAAALLEIGGGLNADQVYSYVPGELRPGHIRSSLYTAHARAPVLLNDLSLNYYYLLVNSITILSYFS